MLLNLRKLFKKYDLSFPGVIHVGGNVGEERKLYKELGLYRQIWFEPITEAYEKLKKNLASNNKAIAVQQALADRVQTSPVNFYIADNNQSSSLLRPTGHLQKHPDVKFTDIKWTTLSTLDRELDELAIDTADWLLVLDIQGAELFALKGTDKTLPKIKCIIAEVYREELYNKVPMVEEIDEYLGERGFVRVETKWTPANWGDGLWLRRDVLENYEAVEVVSRYTNP